MLGIMETASPILISILRKTADRIEEGAEYRWTHQGRCNCGQLIQTATGLGAAEIRERAMLKPGEWSEHAVDYCPVSNHPLDDVIDALTDIGFTARDLGCIEYLNDAKVCRAAKQVSGKKVLDYRDRKDVILYFRTWANLLSDELGEQDESATSITEGVSEALPTLDVEPTHGNLQGLFAVSPFEASVEHTREDSLPTGQV